MNYGVNILYDYTGDEAPWATEFCGEFAKTLKGFAGDSLTSTLFDIHSSNY